MSKVQTFAFNNLKDADLIVDAIYEGGMKGHIGDDALSALMGCGNQGGFRAVGGNPNNSGYRLVVLYSSLDDPDWPDYLDIYTGRFTYFGDNKNPGSAIHKTVRGGNKLLRHCFDILHIRGGDRSKIPPFFIFTKGIKGRDVIFRGLAVPGEEGLDSEDLVAVWKSAEGRRFQNYRAIFTILNACVISREWLNDIRSGNPLSYNAPDAWIEWVKDSTYSALKSEPTIEYRTPSQQIPSNAKQRGLVECIYSYFQGDPFAFESCAVEIAKFMDSNIIRCDITRRTVDGGRDAIGVYRIGPKEHPISLDFALEAKCYSFKNSVGVKEVSRLISRLRHRQFGILVTTSFVGLQAYKELKEDKHPVIIICAADIARILTDAGYGTRGAVEQWLMAKFPKTDS